MKFMLHAECGDTSVTVRNMPDKPMLVINGHPIKEAIGLKVETFPDTVRVTFELPFTKLESEMDASEPRRK